ncbi:very long chain fatty acid elongase 4-like [Halichondria panicea]|uniref:very long chain fatty acid elongase 4-like n=1 Tax=Halichondria panicea TaxID=6063 RepID=UPI00312B830A
MEEATSFTNEVAVLLKNPANFYNIVMENSDPRVKDWLWMQSPFPTWGLILLYILFVIYGPKFMKNRQPLEMKPLLFVFNAAIVVLYVYLTKEYIMGVLDARYNWICQPVVYSYEPEHMRIASALWWYYFSKFIEFFDTVFFILRKKDKQVTFLHVYHHASMFFLWWIGIKWVAGGQSVWGALINSFVHVVMYSYYALSCLGPSIQKYLWWKKHITHLQLLQFSLAIMHAIHSLYIDCNFPKWMHYTLIGYAISFIILFTNFYIQTYIKKGKKQAVAKDTHAVSNGHLTKKDQ